MLKLTFYNNDVITSDTIDSTAALHDVEATLYASDLYDFATKKLCQFRNIRIVLFVQQIF